MILIFNPNDQNHHLKFVIFHCTVPANETMNRYGQIQKCNTNMGITCR